MSLKPNRGEFEVIDLVTRGTAVFNDACEVESARTLSVKIKDDRFDLQFTVVKQPSGKHRHGKWDEDHEQTRVFILDNGDIRKLLEVVFDQERPDFSEGDNRLGAGSRQITITDDSSLSM